MDKDNTVKESMSADLSRRKVLTLSAGAGLVAATAPLQALAAATPPVPRIFQVLFRGETEAEQGYRDYLAENNFKVELTVRNINRDKTLIPGIVQEIRAAKPDLVYLWGTANCLGIIGAYDKVDPAKHITDIPVVFCMLADPIGAKIIPGWETSGRNVTGTSHSVPLDAQIKGMIAYRPVKKLGVIYTPSEPNSVANIKDLKELAKKFEFQLIALPVELDAKQAPIPESVPLLVRKLAEEKVDWIYIGPDSFIGDQRGPLTAKAIEVGVPVFTGTELEIRSSDALCGLVSRYYTTGQFAAFKTMQILRDHIAPSKIPPERMKSFSLVINMRAAKALKLYPPMALLKYAELINLNQS